MHGLIHVMSCILHHPSSTSYQQMDLLDDVEPTPTDEEIMDEEAFEKWMNGAKNDQKTTSTSSLSSSPPSISSSSFKKRSKTIYGSLHQTSNLDSSSSSSSSRNNDDMREKGDENYVSADDVSILSEDLMNFRNKLASQLNLTLMMMNATHQLDALDVHRKIINKQLTPLLEGLMDEQSSSSTTTTTSSSPIKIFRMNRAVYIKSKAFKLDDNSTDLFYIIEDPSTDDNDRGGRNDDDDGNLLPISSTRTDLTPSWEGPSPSSSDSTGSKGNRVGWAVTDSTQVQPGMKGQRQKLLVSVSTYLPTLVSIYLVMIVMRTDDDDDDDAVQRC